MSGIFGIVSLDHAPIDQRLLETMGDWMKYRGSGSSNIWNGGNIGLGNTPLATTSIIGENHHLSNWDGEIWITASARIDDRDALLRKLNAPSQTNLPDDQMILLAYRTWKQDCVQHLRGDFTFAIYDMSDNMLFCARDHFGIEQFYFAIVGKQLIFSNTLGCLLLSPATPREIDRLTLGDFLIFGVAQDFRRTFYSAVKKLAPGYCMTLAGVQSQPELKPYWSLTENQTIRFREPTDYVENFRELLEAAVADRLYFPKTSISLSGGLDGPAIAAVSHQIATTRASNDSYLRAFTSTDLNAQDEVESYYAQLAAGSLNIPIELLEAGKEHPFPSWDKDPLLLPDPYFVGPMRSKSASRYHQMATFSPIILTGMGADALLRVTAGHFGRLLHRKAYGQLLSDLLQYGRVFRKIPALRFDPTEIELIKLGNSVLNSFPDWLNPHFVREFDLMDRWEMACRPPNFTSDSHDLAFWELTSTYWPNIAFALNDAHGLPCQSRHPFFDLRLVNYVLSTPPYLCHNKMILREAIKRRLLDDVRLRKKTPAAGDPFHRYLKSHPRMWVEDLLSVEELQNFIRQEEVRLQLNEFVLVDAPKNKWLGKPLRRVLALAWWLKHRPT